MSRLRWFCGPIVVHLAGQVRPDEVLTILLVVLKVVGSNLLLVHVFFTVLPLVLEAKFIYEIVCPSPSHSLIITFFLSFVCLLISLFPYLSVCCWDMQLYRPSLFYP